MLKLEKTSNPSQLTIRIREKERFFEPRLLKALAFALTFHIGALFLFHVHPFFLDSTFIFPPVHVRSDSTKKGIFVSSSPSYIEEEFFPPPPLPPLILDLDWISFTQESAMISSIDFNLHSLQSIEEKLWPKWEEPLSLKIEEPRVQLAISGDLAQFPLLNKDPLLNQMQPFSPYSSFDYITYEVQLNEKTGELLWYECKEFSSQPDINKLTEKILLNLRFASFEAKEPIKGTISFIVLLSSEKNTYD